MQAAIFSRKRGVVDSSPCRSGKSIRICSLPVAVVSTFIGLMGAAYSLHATPDLYIRDTLMDNGAQPNPDTGPMYLSDDIWVVNFPLPGWTPNPFPTPALGTAAPGFRNQNAEYRDPRLSVPAYIYVCVHNRGTTASAGTEQLHVYFAKASTGLLWPIHWSNYVANLCSPSGPMQLYGQEITRPRINAANASVEDISRYVNAINQIDTASFVYPATAGRTYWDSQTTVHGQAPEHSIRSRFTGQPQDSHNPAFLPWHREFINRLELLMQEAEPLVRLLYWDWTTDPRSTPNASGAMVNLFGNNFAAGSFLGAPGMAGGGGLVSIGLPFTTTPQARRETESGSPPAFLATLGIPGFTFALDPDILSRTQYEGGVGVGMMQTLEDRAHNPAHFYFGTGSDNNVMAIATRDPSFFVLHGNTDRLWATWQRNINRLNRLHPAFTYGADANHCIMTNFMRPWKGLQPAACRPLADPVIAPWNVAGGHLVLKTALDASVVSPPFYDTAPLLIPPLQPGQSVVLQIPWYPPNRANFACFGDPGHFCLLARIEDGTALVESDNLFGNTRTNNNIAWRNIEVVDNFTGIQAMLSPRDPDQIPAEAALLGEGFFAGTTVLVRNGFDQPVLAGLQFSAPGDPQDVSLFDYGRMMVELGPELFQRWQSTGRAGQGIEVVGTNGTLLILTRQAFLTGLPLEPKEAFPVRTRFLLNRDYPNPAGVTYPWDILQLGSPKDPAEVIGGVRATIDFNEICLIKSGMVWRYLDDGSNPGTDWIAPGFPDEKWKEGKANLGFGDPVTTFIDGNSTSNPLVTAYFRHTFRLLDPSLVRSLVLRVKHDDGAIVYLNGREIYRGNMPGGPVDSSTYALADSKGASELAFFLQDLPNPGELLRGGMNVVAVEVHQARPTNSPADLQFDLEVCANSSRDRYEPYLLFDQPGAGALYEFGQPVLLQADALDVDGTIRNVRFHLNDQSIGEVRTPPFQLALTNLQQGEYQVAATAFDDLGQSTTAYSYLMIVSNLLPRVELTSPKQTVFDEGMAIPLMAEAFDAMGSIQSVEFFLHSATDFRDTARSVGLSLTSPYQVTVTNLAAGIYMVSAMATDNRGAVSLAPPIHLEIRQGGGFGLRIEFREGKAIITWSNPDALLESASEMGGVWSVVENIASPYSIMPEGQGRFYRLRLNSMAHPEPLP